MARTVDAIYAVLRDDAPWWLSSWPIGQALLRGLATVLQGSEVTWETVQAYLRSDSSLAGGFSSWVDAHGGDAEVDRYPGESDASYQDRAYLDPRGPTPERIKRIANQQFRESDGFSIGYGEPSHQVADVDFYADDYTCPVFPEGECPFNSVAVRFPMPDVPPLGSSELFADWGYADLDHALPLISDPNRSVHHRLWRAVRDNVPAGTYTIAFIADTGEAGLLVHLGLLFEEAESYV